MGLLVKSLIACGRDAVWGEDYIARRDACVWEHGAGDGGEALCDGDGGADDTHDGNSRAAEGGMDGRYEDGTAGVHREGR